MFVVVVVESFNGFDICGEVLDLFSKFYIWVLSWKVLDLEFDFLLVFVVSVSF